MKRYIKSGKQDEFWDRFNETLNPNTSADRLAELSEYGLDSNPDHLPLDVMKYHISQHRNTPKSVADKLRMDPMVSDISAIQDARNTTSPDRLAELALSNTAEVRKSVADNKYTPDDVLEMLKDDPDYGVRDTVNFRLSDPKGWAMWH